MQNNWSQQEYPENSHIQDAVHGFDYRMMDYIAAKPLFTELTLVSLDGLVKLLTAAMPVGSIYNRGKNNLDLVIILQKTCLQNFEQFENLLNLGFLGYPNGTFSIHAFGTIQKLIKDGNLFYNEACHSKNLIYLHSAFEDLSHASIEEYAIVKEKLNYIFDKEMAKVISFFSGAKEFYDTQCWELAVFMLQQTCELTYRCLLNLFRGKDIKCHELHILRKNAARYAPEIIGVFSEDEQLELAYLAMLDKGYIESRYNRDYNVEKPTVAFLLESVDLLLKRAFALFEDRMDYLDTH